MDVTKEFKNLRLELENFKNTLQGLEVSSREEEIQKVYLGKLTSFKWLLKLETEFKMEGKGVPEEDLDSLLQEVKTHPTQAKKLLLQILQKFPIQPRDQEVLAETFAYLPFAEMEKAVLDLKKKF